METVQVAVQRHSGLGIASLVIGILCAVFIFIAIAIAAAAPASAGHALDEHSAVAIVVGLVIVFFMMVALIGVVLAVIGVFQRDHRKLFAQIGLGINIAVIVGTLALIIIGNMMK
jgi:hypothetical protein